MAVYDSILDTIGRTPVVKLHRIAPEHVTLYAKVESFNPGGSVKDRLALAIILDAEAKGLLKPGDTIVEATSGNTGVGEVLKVARPEVRITASEPAGASLLQGKEWQPHKIQGWTPDFVPDVLNREIADEIVPVTDVESIATARRLAAEEGIFVGISGGATVAAALQVAQKAKPGDVLLAMLPDTGERYFSTPLFEGVNEGSDDEWLSSLGEAALP